MFGMQNSLERGTVVSHDRMARTGPGCGGQREKWLHSGQEPWDTSACPGGCHDDLPRKPDFKNDISEVHET